MAQQNEPQTRTKGGRNGEYGEKKRTAGGTGQRVGVGRRMTKTEPASGQEGVTQK